MTRPEPSDGHGRYSPNPDIAVLQFKADEDRAQCQRDGVDYVEIKQWGADRAIQVRRASGRGAP